MNRALSENPILRHELALVFSRRGAFVRLLAFAAVVAVAIFAIWPREMKFLNMRDRVSRDALTNLAATLQMLVLLFGPAYAATSVTRDRETGFLETLLSGNFTPEQIFRGKAMAATAFLWMLIGSTLPMAAVVMQLGGVAPVEFAAIYLELFMASALICFYGVRCSITSIRSAEALAQVYVRVIPVGALWVLFPQLHPLWLLLPLFLFQSTLRLGEARKFLKYPFDYPLRMLEPEHPMVATQDAALLLRFLLVPWRRDEPMRQWENPIVVRELRYQGLHSAGQVMQVLPWLAVGGIVTAVLFIGIFGRPELFHLAVLLGLAFFVPALGAVAFRSEVDQGTLESLKLTSARRSGLVLGKVWVPFRMGLILLLVMEVAGALLMALFHPVGLSLWLQSILVSASAIAVLTTTSVLWSLLARSTPQSVVGAYATAFVLLVGIPALCRHLFIYNDLALQNYAWAGMLSPSMPFLVLTSRWQWLAEFSAVYGSPVAAWDLLSWNFIMLAWGVAALQLGLLWAIVKKTW